MKRKMTILLFSLLLAVGWTSSAHAQALPAENLSRQLVKAADASKPNLVETVDFTAIHNHSHSTVMPQKHETKEMKLNAVKQFSKSSNLDAVKSVTKSAPKSVTRPNSRANAPLRAGVDLDMKSISKDDADAITYMWDNGDGTGPRPSKATDVAKDPYQMYELLREVYTNPDFPGPYYSAFDKYDARERKVYYGAIEGGWNITGPELSGTMTSSYTKVLYGAKTVANGTNTNDYVPVYGYWYDANTQKNQMIYPANMLGLEDGTVLTSITFYTYRKAWSGGTVKLSLGETTTNAFSNNTLLNATVTEVKSAFTPPSTQGAIEWKIDFDQPYTYHGGNLLVQVETTKGTYGNGSFYGVNNTGYSSCNSYNNSNVTRRQFLPKATFGYTNEEVIEYNPTHQVGEITLSGTNNNAAIRSITVSSGNTLLFSWNIASDGTADESSTGYWPVGMISDYWLNWLNSSQNVIAIGFTDELDPIKLDGSLFAGYENVTITINAASATGSSASLIVNGQSKNFTSTSWADYTWTLNAQTYAHTEYDPDYYLPNEEGYTALIVAVKNDASFDEDNYDYFYDNSYHSTKEQIIEYLRTHVDSIKLLTDGMRVGEANDYSIGTLFNCEGTYNKFFFLGKGQARQKADIVREREIYKQHVLGEYVPFRYMFEEFSPTSGQEGSQTTDFYSKMMEGNVYPVVHDCRSVMELGHQFSMSGNAGITPYAMTGMNFFIPDYRLKYWEIPISSYFLDGRIQNPHQVVSDDGNPKYDPSLIFTTASDVCTWYAQYNQDYAPKVGLYKITLDAEATQVAQDHTEGNRNYAVTLTWVSSLDEMTGHEVPQTYTVYYWDPITGERKPLVVEGVTTVNGETGETTLTYYVEQFATSYILDYIVEGRPDDADHAQFVAISNVDGVVIPGWEDFVGLVLDHHESDFVVSDMANYYRNFLAVVNEDVYNGLTVADITGYNENNPSSPKTPKNTFNLYRWAVKDGVEQGEQKVAVLTFDRANETMAHYKIFYKDEQHTDLTEQNILNGPTNNPNKYQRNQMGIPDSGYVRIKDNGDIIIWPNGYHVNFKSITVKNNGTVVTSWNAETMNTLPNGWIVSPGSKWEEYITSATSDKVGYMEGGGYIAIPNMLNNNTSLTVEIEAYGDGAAVTKIAVNDDSKLIANSAGTTYTWTVNAPTTGNKAPNRAATTITWDFEELSDLDGWGVFDIDGDGDNWGWYDGREYENPWNCHSGYGVMYSQSYNPGTGAALTPDNWLVSPEVTLGGTLTLWAVGQDPNYAAEKFSIMVCEGTSFSYTSDFVQVGATITATSSWTQYTFDLSQFEGQGYFAIRHNGVRDLFRLLIDDVELTLPDSGETPPDPSDPTGLDPTDGGLLRLHLLMVDQFKQEIPDDNSHPETYGYVLKYEPEVGDDEQSGKVLVNIEKTDAQVNGFYTQADVASDTDRHLTRDILTADVSMNLPDENPDVLYYQMQGKLGSAPALNQDYLSKLQYMKNISMYEEMLETSPNLGVRYNPDDTYHYFVETEVQGTYGSSFMTYAPSVSTWGIDRRYFENDGYNNTYGAPIWKTGVGKVDLQDGLKVEKQVTSDGGASASVMWTDNDGQSCNLYMLDNVLADAYLPKTVGANGTNVEYVPYMIRVFVESPTGMLRGFLPAANNNGQGMHPENDPNFTNFNGPWCVYEELVDDYTIVNFDDGGHGITWHLTKDVTNWDNNARFGALSSLITGSTGNYTFDPTNLKVYVRFYYRSANVPVVRGEGEEKGFYASEGNRDPSPWTAVSELQYLGEVVSVTYYNAQGMQSNKPFSGINIVVTRYSDGSTSTMKVMK